MGHLGLPEILFVSGMLTVPIVLALLLFLGLRKGHSRSIQQAVVDKIGSAQDLAAFLQTPAGQRFADSLSGRAADPVQSALRSIRAGIICCVLGAGILFTQAWRFGLVVVFLGAGLIIAAFVSQRLAKSWTRDNR